MTQNIQLGINPLTWTNDDLPSLGAHIPLEQCLAEARAAGFAGIEMGNKFPRTVDALSGALDKANLALVSGWYGSRLLERTAEAEIEHMASHLNLLKSVGAKVMVFAEETGCVHSQRYVPASRRPKMTDAQWSIFAERLTQVADHLASAGVAMAYHYHMGTVVQSEEDIIRMMEMTGDSVGLLVDTGHLAYAGGSLEAVLQAAGNRINHVHCKDVRPSVLADAVNRDRSFLSAVLDGVFAIPGDGMVDFSQLFTHLAQQNYQGWLVIEAEQDQCVAPAFESAQRGYQFLENLATETGLLR